MKNLFVTILTYSKEEFESIINVYTIAGYKRTLFDCNFIEMRKEGEKPVVIEYVLDIEDTTKYYIYTNNRFDQILIFNNYNDAFNWCKSATRWSDEEIKENIKTESKIDFSKYSSIFK